MAETLEVFETTAGTRVKKVRNKNGDIQRFADGTPISDSSYGAYKSHRPATEVFKRGNRQDIDSVEGLGHPFDADTTMGNVNAFKQGSDEYRQAVEINRWIGFRDTDSTPDDPYEAAKEYEQMVDDLEGVEDSDEQRRIKQRYNIGDS